MSFEGALSFALQSLVCTSTLKAESTTPVIIIHHAHAFSRACAVSVYQALFCGTGDEATLGPFMGAVRSLLGAVRSILRRPLQISVSCFSIHPAEHY